MKTPQPNIRTNWRTTIRHASLADSSACDWRVTVVQLVLIWLSHPLIALNSMGLGRIAAYSMSDLWRTLGMRSWTVQSVDSFGLFESDNLIALPGAYLLMLGPALLAMLGEGALAWIPFRIATRRPENPFSLFVRSWWRACLLAHVFIPAFVFVAIGLSSDMLENGVPFLIAGIGIFGPAYFARRERPRMSRWRLACPECGYSLRKLQSPRCPECGESFPTESRFFRRWATRRLIWERIQRGGFALAYVKTVLMIVFRPGATARGLAIPDRFPRAVRWASVHIVLFALLATALSSDLYFVNQIWFAIVEPSWPELEHEATPSSVRMVWWAAQSLIAWLVGLATLPLIGVALAYAAPARRPAARRGVAKWSLYVTLMLIPVAGTLCLIQLARAQGGGFAAFSMPLIAGHILAQSFILLALIYGLWWAMGVAANPYVRGRGLVVFVLNAALYVASWIMITRLLFPPGALGDLL